MTDTLTAPGERPASVLDAAAVWDHRYDVEIHLDTLTGGVPSDPKMASGWLRTRLFGDEGRDDLFQRKLERTMIERLGPDPESRPVDADPAEALEEALAEASMNVNGFKRTEDGLLYVEGRCIKAMLKEATGIGLGSGHTPKRVGLTNKGPVAFVAEHVQVVEDVCPITRGGIALSEPDEVEQHFVHTWRGNSIGYSEVVSDVQVGFTITTDTDIEDLLRTSLVLAEQNGLGARRSQGSGRFVVTRFDAR
jgi:hypothetical protein